MTGLRDLDLGALSDGLQGAELTVAEVVAAWGGRADPAEMAAAQARLAGDAPFLCGVPFCGTGLVAENLVRAGAVPVTGAAPFAVIEDWDGAALAEAVTFRPTPGLLPRRADGPRAPSQVPAIRTRHPGDLRRILQAASLRRFEDPDQVPLPPSAPELRAPCRVGAAVAVTLPGYDVQPFAPFGAELGAAWLRGEVDLALRDRVRADWARALAALPLVVLPTGLAGLVAALGLPALRIGEVILAGRWFADERVLTAAMRI